MLTVTDQLALEKAELCRLIKIISMLTVTSSDLIGLQEQLVFVLWFCSPFYTEIMQHRCNEDTSLQHERSNV